mgnify:CR=1 FL=1
MAKSSLQKRERILISVTVGLFAIVLVQFLLREPMARYRNTMKGVENARKWLEETRMHHDRIVADRSGGEWLKKNAGARKGDLFTFVGRQIAAANLGERSTYNSMNTGVNREIFEQVKVQLNGVRMEEVVDFLYKVYSEDPLAVAYDATIEPNRGGEGEGLKCNLVLVSPRA